MFTGLVEALVPVVAMLDDPPGKRITLRWEDAAGEATIGDSIALNGCCLTVIGIDGDLLTFEAGPETLSKTNLGNLKEHSPVNVERSLKVGDSLGGHFVSGHVDGLGSLLERTDEGAWSTCWFQAPRELMTQMASKGSIAIDGVSLTLNEVEDDRFSVALIPHTLEVTTLGRKAIGDAVNLETDLLAKYVQRIAILRP
jgi:riboflavin synthase